jgi:predicted DNA-binding helix-hairpin-helix protein
MPDGSLDLSRDPKQVWADRNPDFFPISLKKASKEELLRVPGLGPVLVKRILDYRRQTPISTLDSIRMPNHLMKKASHYLSL